MLVITQVILTVVKPFIRKDDEKLEKKRTKLISSKKENGRF